MIRMVDIIGKKRDGKVLSAEEISAFITGFTRQEIPDYQAAALLMAIFLKGMNQEETRNLTHSMMHSGEVIDLSSIPGIKVDKHSTGGVGDKTTLVLAPLVAAAGAPVAKMTGRGMGHTGGTLDKFKAFPGIDMELGQEDFLRNVNQIGVAITGQSANLVPADKKIYALRDVTATVDNLSLIAASIMSKKLASGSDAIVLDVKTGRGAFMQKKEDAFALAKEMVEIGKGMDKKTVAIISDMEQPLGRAIGNTIEVREALATLRGEGPEDLRALCLELGSHMLLLSQVVKTEAEAKALLAETIASGAALNKLIELIETQGGDASGVKDPDQLPLSVHTQELLSPETGCVSALDARTVGLASMHLGAGRETKDDEIDMGAGIYLHKKVGEFVEKGQPLATLYSSETKKLEDGIGELITAYQFSPDQTEARPLIWGKV